jgi:hypothetical protein
MRAPHAFVIGAALIAAAILARTAWSQATTIPLTLAYVVTTCGTAPTVPASTGWAYSNGNVAPLTMNPVGEICVSQ